MLNPDKMKVFFEYSWDLGCASIHHPYALRLILCSSGLGHSVSDRSALQFFTLPTIHRSLSFFSFDYCKKFKFPYSKNKDTKRQRSRSLEFQSQRLQNVFGLATNTSRAILCYLATRSEQGRADVRPATKSAYPIYFESQSTTHWPAAL